MGKPILQDTLLDPIADHERRLAALERSTDVGRPVGRLAPLAADFDFTKTEVDIPGVAMTITVGLRRRLRIAFHTHIFNNDFVHPGGNNTVQIKILEGGTELARRSRANIADSANVFAGDEADIDGEVYIEPTAGTHTYRLRAVITHGPSENMTIVGGAVDPAYMSVEDVGMVVPN